MKIKTIKNEVVALAHRSMTHGFINTMKNELSNADGKINMTRIGVEAIGVLVLVVIWTLIPQIGSAITTNMGSTLSGGWENAPNGTSLWIQSEPMLRICVIVLIAALILAVIFELRAGKKGDA